MQNINQTPATNANQITENTPNSEDILLVAKRIISIGGCIDATPLFKKLLEEADAFDIVEEELFTTVDDTTPCRAALKKLALNLRPVVNGSDIDRDCEERGKPFPTQWVLVKSHIANLLKDDGEIIVNLSGLTGRTWGPELKFWGRSPEDWSLNGLLNDPAIIRLAKRFSEITDSYDGSMIVCSFR